jgi:hypothetical protein
MARLNITIPDALYERLEQIRDRINLSKVCANALEKEVAMLERQPNITDPRIAQLLKRLQGTKERWYQRGHEDGIQWAVEMATREELWMVATTLEERDGPQLVQMFRKHQMITTTSSFLPPKPPMPPMPGQSYMVTQSAPPEFGAHLLPPHLSQPTHEPSGPHIRFDPRGLPGAFPASFHPVERLQYWEKQELQEQGEGPTTHVEVDEASYLEGWRDSVKEIWQAISPAL